MDRIKLLTIFIFILTVINCIAQNRIELRTNELLQKIEDTPPEGLQDAYNKLLSYMVQTAPDKAIDYILNTKENESLINSQDSSSYFLLYLGIAYAKIHIPDTSKMYLEHALKMMNEAKDSSGICSTHIALGHINIVVGDLTAAIQHFVAAEEISAAINKTDSYIDALNYFGIISYILDNLESAIENSEQALRLSRQYDYAEGEALAYEHLAIINIKQTDFEAALEFNSKSLHIREQLDDLTATAELYDNFSIIHNRLGDYDKAVEYTKKSLELRRQYGDINGMGSTYMNLGSIHISLDEYDKALEYFTLAYKIKKESRDLRAFTIILRNLSEIYEQRNDFRNAYFYLREFRIYHDSLFNENARRLISRTDAKHKLENKEIEIAGLQERNRFQSQLQQFLIISLILGFFLTVSVIIAYWINSKANKKLNFVNKELESQKNELAKLNKELVALNSDREKFFSIIAHDLRSPFFPLLTYSEILSENPDKLKISEIINYSKYINQSSRKIFILLENLLQWLGLNSGKMKFSPQNFNLSDKIDYIIELYSENADEKGIELKFYKNKDVYVFADAEMVATILRNLISNAIKFSDVNDKIIIETKTLKDFVEIAVSDTGTGMEESTLSSLFSVNSVSIDGTNNEIGSGLGLLLCKEMVTRNGGDISIESEPGKGTTFRFTLPEANNKSLDNN